MVAEVPPPAETTVHRTDARDSRGKRTQADLALQVCSPLLSVNLEENQHPWDSGNLISDNTSVPTGRIVQLEHSSSAKSSHTNSPKDAHNPPRKKTTPPIKLRLRKKKSGDTTLIDLEVSKFVDVPLQQAEGIELLALIGAANIPIPSHLIQSNPQVGPNLEIGQTSKAPSKKKKKVEGSLRSLRAQPANTGLPQSAMGPSATVTQASPLIASGQPPAPNRQSNSPHPTQARNAPVSQPPAVPYLQGLLPSEGTHRESLMGARQEDEELVDQSHANATGLGSPVMGDLGEGDDPSDDPYLDKVDYSDEEFVG